MAITPLRARQPRLDVSVVRSVIGALGLALLLACSTDDPLLGGRSPDSPNTDPDAAEHDGGRDAATGGAGGHGGSHPTPMAGSDGGPDVIVIPSGTCKPVDAIALHARRAIVSQDVDNSGNQDTVITISKADLYADFSRTCGSSACHGGADSPDAVSPTPFKFTEESFDQRSNLGTQALGRILNDDPTKVMPPGSGDGSERAENDPIRVLGQQLSLWEEAGFPDEFDIVIQQPANEGNLGDNPYLLGDELADQLTNIGSCVPVAASIERKVEQMESLDDLFRDANGFEDLPETLAETDLVSLDSEVLARRGVYSYAPTYTLFSDNAEKMRYVRVPVGEAITYNEQTKDFDIPENTRFYKTFLRKVIDQDGNEGYRKMETRLIVSRSNEQLPDGTFRPRSLKVVYAWDKDELMARKVTDPLRNGQPWADRLCPYVTDESTSREPPAPEDGGAPTEPTNPIIERVSPTCTYMTQEEMDDGSSGTIRHYAIPSTERCDQCHMGSNSKSYILGFSPYHADRRKASEGGIFEDPHEGEIDQLARLIEYGVISGIEPGEAKLEESQGDRSPRNEHELKAQGYMMGNCSFCHNPNGFPTVQNPILAPFDLYPSETGGIFQFPLEKYSERAKFGAQQQTRFPYITPAFGNHSGGGDLTSTKEITVGTQSPVIDLVPGVNVAGFPIWVNEGAPDVKYSRFNLQADGTPVPPVFTFLGPWRSLIWRNVYTPFTYSEDGAIFIHMPRNVPGFDCRAQKIMADWMLSIPAKDCAGLSGQPAQVCEGKEAAKGPDDVGYNLDQPYEEVLPSSPDYTRAVREGENRVEAYRNSVTGQHCPIDTDIVDAEVILSPKVLGLERKEYPSPQDRFGVPPNSPRAVQDPNIWTAGTSDGVPERAHWVPVDTTDNFSQGWTPRRSNWEAVIAERSVPVSPQLDTVIDELQNIHVTDAQKAFSLTPVPMGIWHSACWGTPATASSRTVAELQLTALQRPADQLSDLELWTFDKYRGSPLPLFAPVHEQSRGQAVFRAICQNCHGRDADSRSPLATTIGELTGAETRVANFVDGLLGPKPAPGLFAEDEFRINRGATPADWQVRYMLFMGLGGTEAVIPDIAVSLVKTSPFYGASVQAGGAGGANMLEAASGKCSRMYDAQWQVNTGGLKVAIKTKTFLPGTAEYELWESLCSFQNEPVVRVLLPSERLGVLFESFDSPMKLYRAKDDAGTWVYPSDHPVGNRLGKMQLGIQPDNYLPWCVVPTASVPLEAVKARFTAEGVPDSLMPICPEVLFATAFGGKQIHALPPIALPALDNTAVMSRITRRGAMNAGMAAYYYLDGFTKGTFTPAPAYDECKVVP